MASPRDLEPETSFGPLRLKRLTKSEALDQSSNFYEQGCHSRSDKFSKFIKCRIIPSTENLGPSDPLCILWAQTSDQKVCPEPS